MQRANLRTGLLAGVTVLALSGCSFFHHGDDRSDSASARPNVEQQGSSQQAAANSQPAQANSGTGARALSSGNGYAAGGAADADNNAGRGIGMPRGGVAANAPRRAGTPYADNSDNSPYANSQLTNGAQQGAGTTSPAQAQGAEAGAPQPLVQNNTRNQMQNQLQNQTGLVDVNLNNVKLDVAKNLNIDASKIPVTVQLPVTAAANVCGVDVNALAAQQQQGGGTPTCMANNANEATQAVQTSVQ